MALIHAQFFSEVLGMQTAACVILPQQTGATQIGVQSPETTRSHWPCLWLLHGLSDDHTSWSRRTTIECQAEAAGIAVVMPNVHRSFYTDMAHGGKYWTHLTRELPEILRGFFPLSAARQDNAVAGLSMGGYGATKWLLRHPEMFCAGASLSGALDIAERCRSAPLELPDSLRQETLRLVFGDKRPDGTADDLFFLAEQCRHASDTPPLLQICGTEDFLFADNLRFRDHALKQGLSLTTRNVPGDHNWTFWEQEISSVLSWLRELGFGVPPATSAEATAEATREGDR